ncbi:hypothetical protein WJX74_007121 [Apatococcus lobatus]|uniref:FAD/NAD(P)-binding domain-containing protein n=1 Tax=Apatococcus lobatus TaxID=904363 RepID=A0AAW1QGZ3_9CHLO
MSRVVIAAQLQQRFEGHVPELKTLHNGHFQNLVVGGGPAGYAIVSTLLDGGSWPTLWVDPAFQAGRLAQYLEVPANTKTKWLFPYATTPACGSGEPALEPFQGENLETPCALQASQQMVVLLTEHIFNHHSDKVTMRRGFVDSLQWLQDRWEIDDGQLTADRVFLATGSIPQEPVGFPGVPRISLDDGLVPSKLPGCVTSEDTVCVVGSSHSAMLVLMNLLGMDNGPKVVNVFRSALRYAREGPTGATTYEYTGLKGAAANWARERLETGYYERVGKLQRISTIDQHGSHALKACTKVIGAIGFKRSPLPAITVDGVPLRDIEHDKHTGVIIPGKLYGYGIAFPEEVIDPDSFANLLTDRS